MKNTKKLMVYDQQNNLISSLKDFIRAKFCEYDFDKYYQKFYKRFIRNGRNTIEIKHDISNKSYLVKAFEINI